LPKPDFLNLPGELQDRVLLAAAEALAEHGLRDAKMTDVAERANLPAEGIEQFFDGMPDLIALVLGRGLQYFNQTYIEVGGENLSFWDRVERLLQIAASRGHQFGAFFNVYLNIAASGLPDLVRATFERYEGRASLFYLNLVSTGVKAGAIRNDLDADSIAYHIHDITRFMTARRVHALYQARTAAYFPDYPLTDDGDRRLIRRLIAQLKALYSPA
jgi:AcrR family transcriptional regulator